MGLKTLSRYEYMNSVSVCMYECAITFSRDLHKTTTFHSLDIKQKFSARILR